MNKYLELQLVRVRELREHVVPDGYVSTGIKYRLYPTKHQEDVLFGALRESRLVWNYYVSLFYQSVKAYKAWKEAGDETIPPPKFDTKCIKYSLLPPEVTKKFKYKSSTVFAQVDRRFNAWFGKYIKRQTGICRYKSMQKPRQSFTLQIAVQNLDWRGVRFPKAGYAIRKDGTKVSAPGRIRMRGWSKEKFQQYFGHQEYGRALSVSVSHENNGTWWISFVTERPVDTLPESSRKIGIDVGLKQFATTSDREQFEALSYDVPGACTKRSRRHKVHPKVRIKYPEGESLQGKPRYKRGGPLKDKKGNFIYTHRRQVTPNDSEYSELRRYLSQKKFIKVPGLHKDKHGKMVQNKRPSKHYLRARMNLSRLHQKRKNQRRDYLHKLSMLLIRRYGEIRTETLNVAGMLKNEKLARKIGTQSWATFFDFLTYKADWYKRNYERSDMWSPTSKTCSHCGHHNPDLQLSDRIYKCPECGLIMDRDLNAAFNIFKALGTATTQAKEAAPKVKRQKKEKSDETLALENAELDIEMVEEPEQDNRFTAEEIRQWNELVLGSTADGCIQYNVNDLNWLLGCAR